MMEREELVGMLDDIEAIGGYVNAQLSVMPTEKSLQAAAMERVAGVRTGIRQLIEAHDAKFGALKNKIEERRAS